MSFNFYLDPNGVDIYPDWFYKDKTITHVFLGEVHKVYSSGKPVSAKKRWVNRGDGWRDLVVPKFEYYPYTHSSDLGCEIQDKGMLIETDHNDINMHQTGDDCVSFSHFDITKGSRVINTDITYNSNGAFVRVPKNPKDYVLHLESLNAKHPSGRRKGEYVVGSFSYEPVPITLWDIEEVYFSWYNANVSVTERKVFSRYKHNVIAAKKFGDDKKEGLDFFYDNCTRVLAELSDNFLDQLL